MYMASDALKLKKASSFKQATFVTNPYITSNISDGYRETDEFCYIEGSFNVVNNMPTGTSDVLIYSGYPRPLKNVLLALVSPYSHGTISCRISTNGDLILSNTSGIDAYGVYRALIVYPKA